MDAVAHHDPGTRGRALVVDDDAEQRALLAHALDRAGFEVSTLHDGLELLELLRMAPPRHFQLVVTDQRMPGLHGTEVLARTGSRRTRFVIVSGYDTPQIRAQAEKYGAAAFVIKPFDIGAFVAMLDDILHEDAPQRADGSS
jgi:DNA-binding NtrC family response regulator